MKFLPPTLDHSNLMLLNTYYDKGSSDYNKLDDRLDIIYKDIDTGKKYVETIVGPQVEVYIVKSEFRDFTYMKDFISIEKCDKYKVHYKTKFNEIGKILGCTPKEAKFSNFVFQGDMDVEHFYMVQFALEYETDAPKKLSRGFSDIESDVINIDGFGEPGEAPPNAISYLDANTMTMYTLVCIQDNVPHVDPTHKKYEYYEKLRSRFQEQTENFVNNIDKFVEECNRDFDESYGPITYNVLVFEDEVSMTQAYWRIVDMCDNDYAYFWNAPYDLSNLIERPKVLGLDPADFIPSKEFGKRSPHWVEDKNAMVHKRKHVFDTFTRCTFMDDMVMYAGIRSNRGKLPSTKLNVIAKKELEDEKLDYSEYGNIRMFPYYDFWKFIKYNIKDVLLQYGIDEKTGDSSAVYATISIDCVKPNEVFTSTMVIENSLRLFAFKEKNMVMGSNRNKLFRVPKTPEQIKEEKKNKFAGAFVMHPKHCTSTGFKLLGQYNKYIHLDSIDMDIRAEYPSGMKIMNSCNECMVGKVFLADPDSIQIPLYDNMYLIDTDDEDSYRKTGDKSNLMMEALSENNITEFGRLYFQLPTFTMLSEYVEDHLEEFT